MGKQRMAESKKKTDELTALAGMECATDKLKTGRLNKFDVGLDEYDELYENRHYDGAFDDLAGVDEANAMRPSSPSKDSNCSSTIELSASFDRAIHAHALDNVKKEFDNLADPYGKDEPPSNCCSKNCWSKCWSARASSR